MYVAAQRKQQEGEGSSGPCSSTTVCLLRRHKLDLASIPPNHLNQHFSKLLHGLHATLAFKLRRMQPQPVAVFQVGTSVALVSDASLIELRLIALALQQLAPPQHALLPLAPPAPPPGSPPPTPSGAPAPATPAATPAAAAADASDVQLTPLSFVPGAEVEHGLGPLCLHFIKETWTLREEGGVCNFCHSFIAEAQALARAHVAARGGNAALMYRLTQVQLIDNTYKNHVYALLSLQADVVKLSTQTRTSAE